MPVESVKVSGLDELRAGLRKADKGLAKDLGQAGKAAADIVAQAAKRRIPSNTGKTAKSLRAKVSYGGGAVVFGNAKVSWAGWLDFGGRRPQDKVGRLTLPEGRYIYPALSMTRDRVVREYADAVNDVLRKAGL